MTQGKLSNAKRGALNILDQWLQVTGAVELHSSLYYELQAVVEDAVECGAQSASNCYVVLDGEVR